MASALRRAAVVGLVAVGVLAGTLAPAQGARGPEWPVYGADAQHSGTARVRAISASTAGDLVPAWKINTGARNYASPAVVADDRLGRRLIYTGSATGEFAAYDIDTTEKVWSYTAGGNLTSPAIVDGVAYITSTDGLLYAFDASDGDLLCSFDTGRSVNSPPLVVNPGGGLVVYFGDNGIGGSADGGNVWAVNGVHGNATPDCSLRWVFNRFGDPPGSEPEAGSWSPVAFANDRDGRPMVVFGASNPDNASYALDALTGSLIWRYEPAHSSPDSDQVGVNIVRPGQLGQPDGLAIVSGKTKKITALNLRTGERLWEFDSLADSGVGGVRGTPSRVGNRLMFGYDEGVYSLDATTGAKRWRWQTDTGTEVISQPAVSGPAGDRVAFVGDLAGRIHGIDVESGETVWSYETGGFIYGSAAVAFDRLFIASSDGFLYSFRLGGGASAQPEVSITSPADGATLPNPGGGPLTIRGRATDDGGVGTVEVSVKDHLRNKWYDADSDTWERTFRSAPADLSAPGAGATDWTFSLPTSTDGHRLSVYADAIDGDGQRSVPVAETFVTVDPDGDPPDTTITGPPRQSTFNLPSPPASFPITVTGTAVDTAGADPGVDHVVVVVKNIEHDEFFCGDCSVMSGHGLVPWTADYTAIEVPVDDPGATSVTWELTFPVYDHEHNYRVSAWAVDNDGEADITKATTTPLCVRDPGEHNCNGG